MCCGAAGEKKFPKIPLDRLYVLVVVCEIDGATFEEDRVRELIVLLLLSEERELGG
jgi:hypothetical protein